MNIILILLIIAIIYICYSNYFKENLSKENIRNEIKNILQKYSDSDATNINNNIKEIKKKIIKWIADPNNTFIYNNININSNKIKISKIDKEKKLKIGNIQIYYINESDNKEYLMDSKNMNIIYSSLIDENKNFYFTGVPKIKINNKPNKIKLHEKKNKKLPTKDFKDWYSEVEVKCNIDEQLLDCQCNGDTCTGSEIKDNKCIAYNKINGSEIKAQAICVKSKSNIEYKSIKGNEKNDFVKCNDGDHMISCNCKPIINKKDSKINEENIYDHDICQGSNIENNNKNEKICKIYKNKYIGEDNNIKAIPLATCATISNVNIRHSMDKDRDDLSIEEHLDKTKVNDKSLYKTAKCNKNEHIIGCRCVPTDSKFNNGCTGVYIDPFSNKCQSHHLPNFDSYPDISCLEFNNEKRCLNNAKLQKNKICETNTSTNQTEFIIIKFNNNKFYKLSKIILHRNLSIETIDKSNKEMNSDLTSTFDKDPFLPLKIEILNNNLVLVSAIKKKNNSKILINNTYPPIPENIPIYKNFYKNLEKKGYVKSDNNNADNNINGISSFRQWVTNIHDPKIYSYCSINEYENQNSTNSLNNNENFQAKRYLSCKHPNDSLNKPDINTDLTDEKPYLDLGIDPSINNINNRFTNYTQYFKNENKSDDKLSFCRCPSKIKFDNKDVFTPVNKQLFKNKNFDIFNYILCTPISENINKFDNSKTYKVYKNLKKPCYEYTGEELKNYDEPEIYNDCTYKLVHNSNSYINSGFYYKNHFYFFKNIRIDDNRFVIWCSYKFENKKFILNTGPTILKIYVNDFNYIVEINNIIILNNNKSNDYLYLIGYVNDSIEKEIFKFEIFYNANIKKNNNKYDKKSKIGMHIKLNNIKFNNIKDDNIKIDIKSNFNYINIHEKIYKLNNIQIVHQENEKKNKLSDNFNLEINYLNEILNKSKLKINLIIYQKNILYIFGLNENNIFSVEIYNEKEKKNFLIDIDWNIN